MSYAAFLALFVLPPIALGALRMRARWRRGDLWRALALCCISAASAYPWDSFAVGAGYWSFPPVRIAAWIGPLPAEECAYFVLETLLVWLWLAPSLRGT